MLININVIKTRAGVIAGLKYQTTNRDKKLVVEGGIDKEVMELAVNSVKDSRKKGFSVLVSFKESYDELVKSGKDVEKIIQETLELLLHGYEKDKVFYSYTIHNDTDNCHAHITILNKYESKNLDFWFTPEQLQAICEYIAIKHDIYNTFDENNRQTLSRKIRSLKYDNDINKLKEDVNKLVESAYTLGIVKNRQELIDFLSQNININRIGKDYISVLINDKKIRLRGAMYNENFRIETENNNRKEERIRDVKRILERFIEQRNEKIKSRYCIDISNSSNDIFNGYMVIDENKQIREYAISSDKREQSNVYSADKSIMWINRFEYKKEKQDKNVNKQKQDKNVEWNYNPMQFKFRNKNRNNRNRKDDWGMQR